jgi:hypothetical protein
MRKRHDFFRRGTFFGEFRRAHEEARREVAAININRSPDANALYELFAKRFSLIETGGGRGILSRAAIRRIAKSGAGNRHELAFVLHDLFSLNGIEAEYVEVYSDGATEPHDNFAYDNLEHVLIYVPSLDQHFDPASRVSKELREAAETWLEGKNRMYHRDIPAVYAEGYYAKRPATSK